MRIARRLTFESYDRGGHEADEQEDLEDTVRCAGAQSRAAEAPDDL